MKWGLQSHVKSIVGPEIGWCHQIRFGNRTNINLMDEIVVKEGSEKGARASARLKPSVFFVSLALRVVKKEVWCRPCLCERSEFRIRELGIGRKSMRTWRKLAGLHLPTHQHSTELPYSVPTTTLKLWDWHECLRRCWQQCLYFMLLFIMRVWYHHSVFSYLCIASLSVRSPAKAHTTNWSRAHLIRANSHHNYTSRGSKPCESWILSSYPWLYIYVYTWPTHNRSINISFSSRDMHSLPVVVTLNHAAAVQRFLRCPTSFTFLQSQFHHIPWDNKVKKGGKEKKVVKYKSSIGPVPPDLAWNRVHLWSIQV